MQSPDPTLAPEPTCPSCGASVGDGAGRCPGCGRELAALQLVTCAISWWRGYRSSTFVALNEHGSAVAESPSFPWRRAEPPPASETAQAAHASLVAALEDAGWHRLDGGDASWFDARFGRYVEGSPAPLEPEDVRPGAPDAAVPPQPPAPPPAPPRLVPDPPRLAPPAPPPPRHEAPSAPAPETRRSRRPALVAVAVAVAALVAGVALGYSLRRPHTRAARATTVTVIRTRTVRVSPPPVRAAAAALRPKAAPTTTARAAVAAPPEVVLHVVNVVDRPSWLEVRRDSATGPVLYSAQLAPGDGFTLRARRLWARFGAAANLAISVNGRAMALSGTVEQTFTAAR